MKKLKELKWSIEWKIEELLYNRELKKMRKKYSDYDESYDIGELHHVWGIKSYDDLTGQDCNIHTMNDIEILYHRDEKKYSLSIETAFIWETDRINGECAYLLRLLNAFTNYMDSKGLDKNFNYCLFMCHWNLDTKCKSVEELYFNFKVYVYGICTVRNYQIKD